MKGITKYLSLQYERSLNKKISHYIACHTFHFLSIGRESPAFMTYSLHLNCLVKSPTFRKLFRKTPTFTLTLIMMLLTL